MSKLGLIRPSDTPPGVPAEKPGSPAPAAGATMSVSNIVNNGGDITIVYHASPPAFRNGRENIVPEIRQTMRGVRAETVEQRANVPVSQDMRDIDARDVAQIIETVSNDPEWIAAQVRSLRAAVAGYDPNATAELSHLDAVERTAREGDGAGAIAGLKGLGRWVGKIASNIGAGALAKLIEKQAGL